MKAVLKLNSYLCTLALGTNPTYIQSPTEISIDIFTFGVIQVNRIYFFNCLSLSILLNKSFNIKTPYCLFFNDCAAVARSTQSASQLRVTAKFIS